MKSSELHLSDALGTPEEQLPPNYTFFGVNGSFFQMEFQDVIYQISRSVASISGEALSKDGKIASAPTQPLPFTIIPSGFHITADERESDTNYFPLHLRRKLALIFQNDYSKKAIMSIITTLFPTITDMRPFHLKATKDFQCPIFFGEKPVELSCVGFGLIEALLVLAAIFDPETPGFVLIDDFLSHIHWDLASKFVGLIVHHASNFIEITKRVIVVATHNASVIPNLHPNQIIHFSIGSVPKFLGKSNRVTILESLGLALKHQQGNPLLKALTTRRIVLVEGRPQTDFLRSLLPECAFFSCSGRPTIKEIMLVLNAFQLVGADPSESIRAAILCDRDYRIFQSSEAEEQKAIDKMLRENKLACSVKLFMWDMYELENHLIGSLDRLAKLAHEFLPAIYPSPPNDLVQKLVGDIWKSQLKKFIPNATTYALELEIPEFEKELAQVLACSGQALFSYIKGKRLLHALFAQDKSTTPGLKKPLLPSELWTTLYSAEWLDPSVSKMVSNIKLFLEDSAKK